MTRIHTLALAARLAGVLALPGSAPCTRLDHLAFNTYRAMKALGAASSSELVAHVIRLNLK